MQIIKGWLRLSVSNSAIDRGFVVVWSSLTITSQFLHKVSELHSHTQVSLTHCLTVSLSHSLTPFLPPILVKRWACTVSLGNPRSTMTLCCIWDTPSSTFPATWLRWHQSRYTNTLGKFYRMTQAMDYRLWFTNSLASFLLGYNNPIKTYMSNYNPVANDSWRWFVMGRRQFVMTESYTDVWLLACGRVILKEGRKI